MEPMEADDISFYPCDCRYQVCRFCWAKIINEENGLCPACRKEYNSEKPASYKPISETEESRCRSSRRRKDYIKKTKLNPEMLKILPELRVVQPNLIFVVGLPTWISKDKEILKGQNYFGRYGKIFKVEVNQNQTFGGPQGQPSFSAYITYYRAEDAMRSIRDLNQSTLHGRPIRVSLGTTKYCSQFLRGTKCTKHECMYLHELGDSAASFTKEEMQAGKHTEYMNKLLQDFCQSKSYSLDSQKEETTILGSLDSSVSSPNDASVPHTSESSSYSNGRNRFRFEDTSMLSVENSGVQVSDRCTTQSDQTSASLKEIRKLRHTNKDNSNAVSVSDTSLADKSKLNYNNSNKPSSWNHSSSISSSDYPTRKLGKNSFGTFHFKNSSENTNTDKSYVEGTKGNHVRHHNSTQNRILLPRSIPSNQVSTRTEPICTSSNGCHRTWCRPNPENSSNIQPLLGDEPADIDFDPFRESQQGLAELLAAEVSRLNVSEPLFSHRVCLTNGSSVGISHCPSEPQSSSLDTRLPQANFSLNSAQAEKLRSWYSNIVSHNRSNHVDPNKSFNVSPNTFSNLYPPPGFEEAVQGHDQSSDGQFLTSKTDILNSNYPELSYSCPESFGYSNNVRSTNGSLLQSCAFPCSLPFTGSSEKLMTTDNWIQAKKVSDHNAIHSDTLFSSIPAMLPDISNALKQDDLPPHLSSQFMTNIFNAVLNSQSSMHNNESTGTHDKSSTKSSASMFDFSQFVNHLYHQSSGILDINAHNPNQWSTRVNIPFACTQNEVLDASIYSSSLAPMSNTLTFGKYGSKMCSLPNSNDYQQHQKMAFSTNNNNATNNSSFCCNTGLTDMDSHPTSTNSASSFTWQLDDPAILSSRLSSSNSTVKNNQISSTDLLEPSTAAAASSSSYISQSGVKNQSRQQPLPPTGDTIIHPSSHSQLKE
ncbi:CCR4-NOT transcription complex subunit 4, variant 4 [Schistosoma haematobium]|uniref:CCR4-NOT transcription complex subunit 4, variant 4 n=1 Tax=Schistosoma haematobium TaxID=6185 RepID=A0A922LJC4_SCHHA|nr:CCR4-NOT transcription complex subunit 4, variant 4 [Schistosoma haematobium]KAH9586935.1 CCR4-NOT transcription complex subunit 4, variant 4 [Schistosoma haematobium]